MQMRVMALQEVLATISPRFARAPKGLGVLDEAKPTTGGKPRGRVLIAHGSTAAHVG